MRKEMITALATGAVVLQAFAPLALADTALQVSGNGAGSTSDVNASSNNSSSLVQSNNANVTNTVSSNSNTGGNNTDENTGGNVTVDTGNALATTDITTRANANLADLSSCSTCNSGARTVSVSGNGADSRTNVNATSDNTSQVFQTNDARVTNDVQNNAQTGNNNANRNTGGDVLVLTGHAGSDTTLDTAVNANVASTGGSNSGTNGGQTDLRVLGNGAGSDNTVDVSTNNSATVVQDNNANVRNRVNSDLTTGRNNADENTGGNVTVDTGNALARTAIDTMANFNSADLSNCGCLSDTLAKVSGNGAFSQNQINARANDDQTAFQTNSGNFNSDVTANNQTGNNNAQRNTGIVVGDPVDVITGHSGSDTSVQNTANVNSFGPHMQLPGGFDVNFTFDLNNLLNSLHM